MTALKKLICLVALLQVSVVSMGADVFVRHNINGGDLGLDVALPVDIEVAGGCLATGVTFNSQLGPVALDPGQYNVKVKLSDGACGGATVLDDTLKVQFAENLTAVAHLSDIQAPTFSVFKNNAKSVGAHQARVSLRHTADAPEVKIYFVSNRHVRAVFSLQNGASRTVDLPVGHYKVYIFNQATGLASGQVVSPIALDLQAQTNTVFYAVGSTSAGSFGLETQKVE